MSSSQEIGGASPLGAMLVRIVTPLDISSRYIMIATMTLMALVVCAQVVLRFVFSHSIDWADEISRLFFVWSMFLAIPHGLKLGVHVGIDVVVNMFSPKWQSIVNRLMLALSAALCIIVFVCGIYVVQEKWEELMPTIDFTAAVYYIPVLISMIHSFFHLCILTVCGTDYWTRGQK